MTDKERRDKRFRKALKWMSEAREIGEMKLFDGGWQ